MLFWGLESADFNSYQHNCLVAKCSAFKMYRA